MVAETHLLWISVQAISEPKGGAGGMTGRPGGPMPPMLPSGLGNELPMPPRLFRLLILLSDENDCPREWPMLLVDPCRMWPWDRVRSRVPTPPMRPFLGDGDGRGGGPIAPIVGCCVAIGMGARGRIVQAASVRTSATVRSAEREVGMYACGGGGENET